MHLGAHPCCDADQRGSEGITVLRNLSCLSSRRGPFLDTVTRGIPFCSVQVCIMAVRFRCSPANRYCRRPPEIKTCKVRKQSCKQCEFFKRNPTRRSQFMFKKFTYCILGGLTAAVTVFSWCEVLLWARLKNTFINNYNNNNNLITMNHFTVWFSS